MHETTFIFIIALILWAICVLLLAWIVTPRPTYGRRATDFARRSTDLSPSADEESYFGFGAVTQIVPLCWRRLRVWWWSGHDRRLSDEDRRRV